MAENVNKYVSLSGLGAFWAKAKAYIDVIGNNVTALQTTVNDENNGLVKKVGDLESRIGAVESAAGVTGIKAVNLDDALISITATGSTESNGSQQGVVEIGLSLDGLNALNATVTDASTGLVKKVSDLEGIDAGTRLGALEGIDASTRLGALEGIDAGTRLGALEGIDAGTRLGALETAIGNADSGLGALNTKVNALDVIVNGDDENDGLVAKVEALASATDFVGVTTTELTNESTTTTIKVNGQDYNVERGDIAIYNNDEFVFDGTKWHLLGNADSRIQAIENRVGALEGIDAGTRLGALEGIDAGTRLGALEGWVEAFAIPTATTTDCEDIVNNSITGAGA